MHSAIKHLSWQWYTFLDSKIIPQTMNKFLIIGGGGRESIFAQRLWEDTELYAVIPHENPLIIDCVKQSGGAYLVGDSDDPNTVLCFAKKHHIDYIFVNADQPLANGVVDILLENKFKAIGGTKDATRIEWDKVYAMDMMQRVCPKFTPFYKIITKTDDLENAVSEFESKAMSIVVKPQGLTGGKGVKVMPEHLPTYKDCIDYAANLLAKNPDENVLFVEKLDGIEFTIMGITDGKTLIVSPASYDYPFRYDDDTGAGTGGMGCFTNSQKNLPFMNNKDMDECTYIMQSIIDEMRNNGLLFNGVINGGFFKTRYGIKFMEFNGRFGDPEALNILSVLQSSFSDMLIHIWNKTLSSNTVSFVKKASVVKYLVAKEYPQPSDTATVFTVNQSAAAKLGVQTFFASCVRIGPLKYQTLKRSRVVAFVAVSDNIDDASQMVNKAIDSCVTGNLEYRCDIGSQKSLEKLAKINLTM